MIEELEKHSLIVVSKFQLEVVIKIYNIYYISNFIIIYFYIIIISYYGLEPSYL